MDFRQLRYFVALAETLHFGRAAARLHITQPPLSRQIAALEETLSVQLVARHSRHVELTPAGADFYAHAVRLLADFERAGDSARATAAGAAGELRLGFAMYAAFSLLPRLVRGFSDDHPRITLGLEEILPRDIEQALVEQRIDIGIGMPIGRPGRLEYRPLAREPLCAVLPATHPLAGQATVDVARLADEPFVTLPRTTAPALHDAVLTCCAAHGFVPRIRLETHLQQTIVTLVAEGLGVGLVPASLARLRMDGAVFAAIDQSPPIEQGLYWRRGDDNPCLAAFIESAQTRATSNAAPD
ncbi:LysR family transcriptional regulator [Salinisphaera hydrothermalis]|uniref:LysR family transcriptional regulator n=1 Tax=Salinisphaera hydrothermalis (strain C41B8) TaxID=1304275 RepID=A0A084IR21_SALHC|nr:LysR family transcriptional regulator [Salinisphaera hydrothermalis]KEZ79155.1 LysR family transcriptional regulator [Salinisphaera hydrothermalis C41B8]